MSAVALPVGTVAIPAGASAIGERAECTAEQLALPGGGVGSSGVHDADPTGRYLLGRWKSPDGWKHIVWADGEPSVLPRSGIDAWDEPADVNSSGAIVGYSVGGAGVLRRAWTYVDGQYTVLPNLEGTVESWPEAINANGDVVGVSRDDDGDRNYPVIWPADEPGTVRELPASVRVYPEDISDDGVVVGDTTDQYGSVDGGYVWTDVNSEGTRLTNENGDIDVRTNAVSGDWVAGVDYTTYPERALVWNLDTGQAMSRGEGILNAVNGAGDASTEQQDSDPSVLTTAEGGTVKLPGLDGAPDVAVTAVFEPDSDLTAAGRATTGFTAGHAVVWRGC